MESQSSYPVHLSQGLKMCQQRNKQTYPNHEQKGVIGSENAGDQTHRTLG